MYQHFSAMYPIDYIIIIRLDYLKAPSFSFSMCLTSASNQGGHERRSAEVEIVSRM